MGEVYIAHDARLNRNVALKIITAGSSADATRQRRFTVEARAASALNHPNIITVHDFGSSDGISYIVSELVDGNSLRSIINRGPLPVRELLEIAVQIADGLEAAHEAGIVHRDLKPENIMITRGGRVKILDFGLAKPVLTHAAPEEGDSSEATFDGTGTQPGLIVGTVGYMSPEQARGDAVSFESDQFSLGLLLHEMATGQPGFKRDTPMQTLLAIANVDRLPFTPGPVAFRLLVERLLSRDPAQRFRSTAEVHERLRKILSELPSVAPPEPVEEGSNPSASVIAPESERPAEAPPEKFVRRRAATALLGALVVFSLGVLVARMLSRPPDPDLSRYAFAPLTTSGVQVLPAISPDGTQVAFSQPVSGVFQIFVQPFEGGRPVQLTKSGQDCLDAAWSLGGLYFISAGSLWSVSTYGGEPQPVVADVNAADPVPDGGSWALLRSDGVWRMRHGSAPERLEAGSRLRGPGSVRFAPNGQRVAVWQGGRLWVVSWPKGEARVAYTGEGQGFAWMPDGHRVVFGRDHLWMVDVDTGKRIEFTNGTGNENWPSLARDGKRAVFSKAALHTELVAVGTQMTLPEGGAWPAWSPVRNEFAYVSGESEIRLRDAQSGWEKPIARAAGRVSEVVFSPDGQRVAYVSGGFIWVAGLNNEEPLRTVEGTSPAWSGDGNALAFVRDGAIWQLKLGHDLGAVTLRSGAFTAVRWSGDGKWLAGIDRGSGLWLMPAAGGPGRKLPGGDWLSVAWGRDGVLVGARRNAGHSSLDVVAVDPVTGGETVRDALGPYSPGIGFSEHLGGAALQGMSVSPDGRTLLAGVPRLESTLWSVAGL